MERNPLWPALPPPRFTLSFPGRKSISSCMTRISVHKGLRLQQQPPFTGDQSLRNLSLEAAAEPRGTVPAGDRVDRHEADIVSVAGVARTGIAKADDETHHQSIADAAKPRPAGSGCSRRLSNRWWCGSGSGGFLAHGRGRSDAGDREVALGDHQP